MYWKQSQLATPPFTKPPFVNVRLLVVGAAEDAELREALRRPGAKLQGDVLLLPMLKCTHANMYPWNVPFWESTKQYKSSGKLYNSWFLRFSEKLLPRNLFGQGYMFASLTHAFAIGCGGRGGAQWMGGSMIGRLKSIVWCDDCLQFYDLVIAFWYTFVQKQSPYGKDGWQQSHHMIVLPFRQGSTGSHTCQRGVKVSSTSWLIAANGVLTALKRGLGLTGL